MRKLPSFCARKKEHIGIPCLKTQEKNELIDDHFQNIKTEWKVQQHNWTWAQEEKPSVWIHEKVVFGGVGKESVKFWESYNSESEWLFVNQQNPKPKKR